MSWLLRKIIHNDAIKEDPPEIYGWRVFFLASSVSGLASLKLHSGSNLAQEADFDVYRPVLEVCSSVWSPVLLVV